jgi:hypothetical protein
VPAAYGGIFGFVHSYEGSLRARISESVIRDNTLRAVDFHGGLVWAQDSSVGQDETVSHAQVTFDRSLVTANTLTITDPHKNEGSLFTAEDAAIIFQNTTVHANEIIGGTEVATVGRTTSGRLGRIIFSHATVTDNLAENGGGWGQPLFGLVVAMGSVFSGNTGAADHTCSEPPTSLQLVGHTSWFDDPQGCEGRSGDAKLGPLADNGGFTLSRLPLADSPLVDGGDAMCRTDNATPAITLDQRGQDRPHGAACDIGSVEAR